MFKEIFDFMNKRGSYILNELKIFEFQKGIGVKILFDKILEYKDLDEKIFVSINKSLHSKLLSFLFLKNVQIENIVYKDNHYKKYGRFYMTYHEQKEIAFIITSEDNFLNNDYCYSTHWLDCEKTIVYKWV